MIKTSPNATAYRNAKKIGEALYKGGITDVKVIARNVGVKPATVSKWIKVGGWVTKDEAVKDTQEKILSAADDVLLKAFERFSDDPLNKDLQSLNSMFKTYLERSKPDKKLLEYIIRFQEDVIEFCMQTGNDVLRKHYQEILINFSEFLRKKYV